MRSQHFALIAVAGLLPVALTCSGGDSTAPRQPAALTLISGHAQIASVGQALPGQLYVRVDDASGAPMKDVTVVWAVTSGGGSVSPGSTTTDAQGLAATTWTLGSTTGVHSATASVADHPTIGRVTFTATAQAGSPAKLAFTVPPSAVTAGTGMSPAVQVTVQDAWANTVTTAATSITVAITSGTGASGAVLGGTLTLAAVGGVAGFGDLTIDKAGSGYTLAAAATGLTGATSAAFTVRPGAAATLNFTVQPSAVTAGLAISPPVQITLRDALGNTANTTANVTMAVTTGSGTAGAVLRGTLTQSAVSGVATFADLTIDKAGSGYTLTASVSGLGAATSAAFAVGVGAAAKLGFTVQPSAVAFGVAISPAVQVAVQDAAGNTVTGATTSITVAITSGTGASGAVLGGTLTRAAVNGVATFADLTIDRIGSGYTLTAGASGLTATSAGFAVSSGPAAKLAFTVQPNGVTAGTAISPAVRVTIQDAAGNTVTSATTAITVAITSGTGTTGAVLGGTSTQAAVNGAATFGNLTIDKAGTGYTLAATATALTGATSGTFSVTAGAATRLAFAVQPSPAAFGVPISPAVQVAVQDAVGNTVTSATTSITVAITSGTGASGAVLGGTLTRAAVGGVATFGDLSLDKVGTGYTLAATGGGLASATSAAFDISLTAPLTTTQAVPSKAGTVNTLIPTFIPVTASGGTLPYTFALSGGAPPTGMSFNTGTGAVSGTPSTTLVATVYTVTVTDAVAATSAKTFTLTVNGPLTATQAVPSTTGTVNTAIPTFTPVAAAGGTTPYAFALSGGALPTGTTFNTGSGAVSGTPTTTLAATNFTVTVTDAATATASNTFSLAVTDPCSYATATPVTVGLTVNAALASGDCQISSKYVDQYALTLSAAADVQIELTSSVFDTYLTIRNAATGSIYVVSDDDPVSGTRNSRINLPFSAGAYILQASSYLTGTTGAYKLRICSSAPNAIALGETKDGTLETTDCGLAATGDGTYIDRWQFSLTQPTAVTITQTSTAFDAFLWLLPWSETSILAYDDNGAGGTDARILRAAGATLQPGTYSIWTNSYSPATGAYQISLSGQVDYCQVSESFYMFPQTVSGELTNGDCRLSDGSHADRWELYLPQPTAVRIDMTSTAFDAFLFMQDANGNTVASDDDAGGGTNARIEGTFPTGVYVIWANSFVPGATGAYDLAVATPPAGAVNLRIDRLYLVQSTQSYSGAVPLVRGRDALLRVFVRADQGNSVMPDVRVRTYISGVLQSTRTIAAPGTSVPTTLNEGSLASSWNVIIPAAEIQPGAQILADVDPTNAITEGNEADNSFPASGTAAALDVRTMPTLYITLVPIRGASGLTGNVSTANQDQFLNLTRRMWPFSTVDPVVHSTYTTTTAGTLLSDGTNWTATLSELLALRTVEGSARNYFGIVKVTYTSGVAGLGYIGQPAAIGWDYLPSGDGTVAHELGHNFNRLHSPCGGAAGPDPYYPYAAGAIGVYGYDVAGASLMARTMPDLMTYCHPEWISDYTFTGALDYIVAHPTSPTIAAGSVPSVLIWGRIDDGVPVLEPAVEVMAAPTPLPASGPYHLQGIDASGRTLLDLSFAGEEVADAPTPTRHFAFLVPKSSFSGAGLSELRLSGPAGASASVRSSGAAANAALVGAAATATRSAAGGVEVRWDSALYPLAVVRSTVTGEILAFARGGLVTVPTTGAEVEVILSDGVRSATRRLVAGP